MELMLRKSERQVHQAVEQTVQEVARTRQYSRLLVLTLMAACAKEHPQGCYDETVLQYDFDPLA